MYFKGAKKPLWAVPKESKFLINLETLFNKPKHFFLHIYNRFFTLLKLIIIIAVLKNMSRLWMLIKNSLK